MPSFEYEPLILSPKPKISNEKEDKGDIDGAGPSNTRVPKKPWDLKGGKDSLEREDVEQTLEQIKSILQEINSHDYASPTTKIWEHIQLKEHITQEDHHGQIEHVSKL